MHDGRDNIRFDDMGRLVGFPVDYAMHDKEGNLISGRTDEGRDLSDDEPDQELELTDEGIRPKEKRDPEKEPMWIDVRGMTSFYHICPRCAAMIPGTGPQFAGADGVERGPKEHHENYHRTILCDWYLE